VTLRLSPSGGDVTIRIDSSIPEKRPNTAECFHLLEIDIMINDFFFFHRGFGDDFIRYYSALKLPEQQRFEQAEDPLEFQRREYFSRL